MEEIHATATFPAIAAANAGAFKQLAAELLQTVRGETGTLQYDWFFNEDGTQCVLHEAYSNSDAALVHIGNAGPSIPRLMELSGGLKLELFGDPSAALRDAIAPLDPLIYSYAQGKR